MINVGSTKVAGLLPNYFITTNGKKDYRTLYLTFDDGPDPTFTIPICELLDTYSIKATFFCIGNKLAKYPEIAQRLLGQGHIIANHSNTHRSFGAQPLSAQLKEAKDCQSKIENLDPSSSKIFRAPKGELSIALMLSLLVKRWNIVHWSYDSMDYKKGSLNEQLQVFKAQPVNNGDILLFHDDNQLAIDILESLLPQWVASGFKFGTIQDLLTSR